MIMEKGKGLGDFFLHLLFFLSVSGNPPIQSSLQPLVDLSCRLLSAFDCWLQLFEIDIQLPGQVNLSEFSPGIYFIKVQQGERSWLKRVIKK
jgi:hypothetical protein